MDKPCEKPVAIIGAGIVGVATAVWLQRYGRQVVLIDRLGPAEGTSHGNAGVLAACSVVPVTVPGLISKAPGMLADPDQPLYLRWSYLPSLAPWLARYLAHCRADEVERIAAALYPLVHDTLKEHLDLAEGTTARQWIRPGDYVFAYSDESAFRRDAFAWRIRESLGYQFEALDGASFRAADPVFSHELGYVIRVGGHGRVADPGRYTRDLAQHVLANGGRWEQAEIDDIVVRDGKIEGLVSRDRVIPCSDAVLATGAWSGPLSARLGIKVPLESERGYHLDLWGATRVPQHPVMISSLKVVATPMADRVRLAGAVEFAGLNAEASKPPFAMLERAIRRFLPGIEWRQADPWMGHRPAPADSIPVIGESPLIKRAFVAFGHHHIGLTAAAKTGRELARLITAQTNEIDLRPYSPGRFGQV